MLRRWQHRFDQFTDELHRTVGRFYSHSPAFENLELAIPQVLHGPLLHSGYGARSILLGGVGSALFRSVPG
jgi:hypothetical protein